MIQNQTTLDTPSSPDAPTSVTDASQQIFPKPTDARVNQCSIMIVDDEESVVLSLKKHLQQHGFRSFHLATDATTVLDIALQKNPDLILMDVKMSLSGLELLKSIRGDQLLSGIPVIMLTADKDSKTKIKALTIGADDFLTKPVDAGELVARVRNTLAAKVLRDQLTTYTLALQSDVLLDELTQIANRRAFEYELNRRVIEWKRYQKPLSLALIDLDYFKKTNDRFGHPIGDQVLITIANTIRSTVREMDLVARYGGEEFAVIMPATNIEDACLAGERIRSAIGSLVLKVEDQSFVVTASVGIASASGDGGADSLVVRADKSLYASKRAGRNCTSVHDGRQSHTIATSVQSTEKSTPLAKPNESEKRIPPKGLKSSRIIVVDDEPSTSLVVKKLLNQTGYSSILTENNSRNAFTLIKVEQPDLVLLDIRMPEVNGLEILQQIRGCDDTRHIPVIILTSETDADVKIEALNLGASDLLYKPVNEAEMKARVRNTLLAKKHVDHLADYSSQLEHEVRLRTAELTASRREAIQCLARAAEIRDDCTGHHIIRVGRYASIIADEMGFDRERTNWIEHAAQLHDVGKIGVPDSILKKPESLTDEEYQVMKDHCKVGASIIRNSVGNQTRTPSSDANTPSSIIAQCQSPIMQMAAMVAETHHERWDGKGYPLGLSGEQIPIEGRITSVADVFDALSTKRCYKDAIYVDTCFKVIKESSGTQFDPDVVAAFVRRRQDILDVFHYFKD